MNVDDFPSGAEGDVRPGVTRWEYRTVTWTMSQRSGKDPAWFDRTLNELGDEGWEAVSLTEPPRWAAREGTPGYFVLFKRPRS